MNKIPTQIKQTRKNNWKKRKNHTQQNRWVIFIMVALFRLIPGVGDLH